MKHLLIIFTLLLTSVSWSKSIDSKDLVETDGLWYEKFTNEPFTGNSTRQKQGKVKDGKKEGEWLYYSVNGKLHWKSNYKDGKLHGEWLGYDENGKLRETRIYKDGKLDGEWLWYDKNGKLYSTDIYKDGKLIEEIRP